MDTNKKSFFTYGANLTVSRKSCVESVALLILFLTPSIFIGGISIFVIVLSIMIVGIYIKSIYGKFDSKRLIRGHLLFLHNGMLGLCMTFSFLMMGIRILLLLYPPQYHLVIVVMVFLFILIVLTFYILWTNQLIKKGRFKNVKAVQGGTSFIVFAVLGRAIARETTKGLNNEGIFKFLAICCFILVSLTLLGALNLYKYYYIIHSSELMKEIEKILKNEDEKTGEKTTITERRIQSKKIKQSRRKK